MADLVMCVICQVDDLGVGDMCVVFGMVCLYIVVPGDRTEGRRRKGRKERKKERRQKRQAGRAGSMKAATLSSHLSFSDPLPLVGVWFLSSSSSLSFYSYLFSPLSTTYCACMPATHLPTPYCLAYISGDNICFVFCDVSSSLYSSLYAICCCMWCLRGLYILSLSVISCMYNIVYIHMCGWVPVYM